MDGIENAMNFIHNYMKNNSYHYDKICAIMCIAVREFQKIARQKMLDISVKQMKYAVEIGRCGSINQAAQNLYVTQSSLSKAMKELESVLGYAVFHRSPGGTTVTKEGREFLQIAEEVVYKLDYLERQIHLRKDQQASINISIPRATYITYAFTEFFKEIQNLEKIQINFSETNSAEAVDNILHHGFHLGIIRYPDILEENTIHTLQQKKLRFRRIWTFDYMLLVSKASPLASRSEIHPSDLHGYIELLHGDTSNTFLPERADGPGQEESGKRIYLYERGSQFDFLSNVPTTYMWVSPLPEKVLQQHELVQIPCPDNRFRYNDILIYHEDYPFGGYAEQFYNILLKTKDEIEKTK